MMVSLDGINKAFENRVRLGIMSVLLANGSADIVTLKSLLNLSDGNLASHIKALEKEEFIGIEKSFIGKKPNTRYFITKEGREAFNLHLESLEKFLKTNR